MLEFIYSMQLYKLTGSGLVGALVLGTSLLVPGCQTTIEDKEDKLEYAIDNRDIEYLLSVVNDQSVSIEKEHFQSRRLRALAASSLMKLAPDNDRVVIALAKNLPYLYLDNLNPRLEVLPELLKLLDDKNPDVRYSAVRLIGKIGPSAQKKALLDLLKILKNENSAGVRLEVLIVLDKFELRELEAKKIIQDEILTNGYLNDEDPSIRRFAGHMLGRMNTKESALALVTALKNAGDIAQDEYFVALTKISPTILLDIFKEQKGMNLFRAINSIGPRALPSLLNALEREKNPVNKANIILLLGTIGGKEEIMQNEILKILTSDLDDESKYVRCNAATSLGMFGARAKNTIEILDRISRSDKEELVRKAAENALIDITNQN